MLKNGVIDLQLFGDGGNEGNSENNNQNQQGTENNNNSQAEKTYTQTQVNAMLANEKRQGKQSILRALGIKDVNEGKNLMQQQSQQRDEEGQAAELLSNARQAQTQAEQRATAAERKLAVIKLGVKPEFVDDVVFIASGKATDAEDFESVIAGMKETHSFYFVSENNNSNNQNNGTGGNTNYKKQQQKQEEAGSLGKRLAQQRIDSMKTEVKFFDN